MEQTFSRRAGTLRDGQQAARPSDARQVRTAALVMVVLVAVWGYAWVLSKLALQYCGPFEFATLRTAVGAAFLFPALLWQRKPLWPDHPEEAFLVGVVQTGLFLLLNNRALSLGEPGKTSVLAFTMHELAGHPGGSAGELGNPARRAASKCSSLQRSRSYPGTPSGSIARSRP